MENRGVDWHESCLFLQKNKIGAIFNRPGVKIKIYAGQIFDVD